MTSRCESTDDRRPSRPSVCKCMRVNLQHRRISARIIVPPSNSCRTDIMQSMGTGVWTRLSSIAWSPDPAIYRISFWRKAVSEEQRALGSSSDIIRQLECHTIGFAHTRSTLFGAYSEFGVFAAIHPS